MTYQRCHNYIYNTFVDMFTLQYLQKIQQSVYILYAMGKQVHVVNRHY